MTNVKLMVVTERNCFHLKDAWLSFLMVELSVSCQKLWGSCSPPTLDLLFSLSLLEASGDNGPGQMDEDMGLKVGRPGFQEPEATHPPEAFLAPSAGRVFLKMWSSDQRHQPHLGTCQNLLEMQTPRLTLDLQIRHSGAGAQLAEFEHTLQGFLTHLGTRAGRNLPSFWT